MLTQSCFPWPLNRGCGTFTVAIFSFIRLPFQDTYDCKLSHQVLSSSRQISCPFFQEAFPLTALSVS